MSEPVESPVEPPFLAWDHLRASSPPELRRWLNSGKPVALHADLMMVAVPNIFTRNQLEVRFRPDIEQILAGFFGRSVHLAVLVDDSLEGGTEDYQNSPPHVEETNGRAASDDRTTARCWAGAGSSPASRRRHTRASVASPRCERVAR